MIGSIGNKGIVTSGMRIALFCLSALFTSCSKSTETTEPNYIIVWRYTVSPPESRTFEHEYGEHGTWHKLFSQSANYQGSTLRKSDENDSLYLLVDTWSTRKSYDAFKEIHREEYDGLSKKFEELYLKEEKIGSFGRIE